MIKIDSSIGSTPLLDSQVPREGKDTHRRRLVTAISSDLGGRRGSYRLRLASCRVSRYIVVHAHGEGDSVDRAQDTDEATGMEMRTISLTIFLFAFWLALSGHYTPMLVAAGLVSAGLCAMAAGRMCVLDSEGHPIHLLRGAVKYYPWLLWEIVKSAWSVTKIILHPSLPISPAMITVTATQHSAAGVATYANSITLTPGTLTVGVSGNELTVHALTLGGALDLEAGHMDRRVTRFEGGG